MKTQVTTLSTQAGSTPMSTQTPDYGLDAGRAVRAMFIVGPAGAIGGFLLERWTLSGHLGMAYTLQILGFLFLILATLMFASSRFGKFHARDRILSRLKLRGDEALLDVGCGHGLLLVAAAKLLPRGRAVEDGDMRKMPFADGSFDATVAHFAIHNITAGEGRREAIREIVRTLKPGGQVAISDLQGVDLYADELRKSKMIDVEISQRSFWTFPPARTVTARKPSPSV
jgi:arsenite methyltransferase